MKRIMIVFLLLLISCSTTTQSQQAKVEYTTLKLTSKDNLTASFEGKEYDIKSDKIEEIQGVIKGITYNVTVWNKESYKTINQCRDYCVLRLDKKGNPVITPISKTNTSYTFKVDLVGDVREPYFCIQYSDIAFKGINAIEIAIPPEKQQNWDRCYNYTAEIMTMNYSGMNNESNINFIISSRVQ